MNSLYNLRMLAPNKYQMAKFDSDFNVEAIYNLEPKGHDFTCDCPANQRSVITKRCKHRRFLPFMIGAANTNRFYDPETGRWHEPLAHLGIEAEPEQPAAPVQQQAEVKEVVAAPLGALPPSPPSGQPTIRRR